MATFVMLACFTDQGIRNIKDTTKRADAFKELAKKFGATLKDVYWTQGRYDIVVICEAPDAETASALAFTSGAMGNIRTETLRAFSEADMGNILGKMG